MKLDADLDDPPAEQWLGEMMSRVVGQLDVASCQLSVVVVADARMRDLHAHYTGESGTTDVLTFDLSQNDRSHGIDGEVVVCWDEARRQAAVFDHPPQVEVLLYAVHGLLHLLGHDDHMESDRRMMHQKEDALLSAVGLGPVYHAEAAATPDQAGNQLS